MAINNKTLIFDLDGTLSDPSEGVVNSFIHALDTHDLPQVTQEIMLAEIGPPLDRMFSKLTGVTEVARIESLVFSYRKRYAVRGYAENSLYPNIPEVLSYLFKQGIRLGLCTSKRVDFAEKILDMFGLRDYFAFVDGGDTGISKAMQLRGLLDAGLINNAAIMIGDRAIDIESARANGMVATGVLSGFGDRSELESAEPQRILTQVTQLTQFGEESGV